MSEKRIVNRREMINLLLENPKRRVFQIAYWDGSPSAFLDNEIVLSQDRSYLTYKHKSGVEIALFLTNDKAAFEVIEPERKLKEMSFGEAYYLIMNTTQFRLFHLKSVISGKDFTKHDDVSLDEFKGLWTIDGIYEDEE